MNDWTQFVRYVVPIALILALLPRRFLTPKPHGGAVFGPRRIMVVWALSAVAAGCGHSQTAPSTGTNAVSVISVDLPNGGTAASGQYYVLATVQFQSPDLLVPTTIGGFLSRSVAVFVCLSVDGVLIANVWQRKRISSAPDVAVIGPDARRNEPDQLRGRLHDQGAGRPALRGRHERSAFALTEDVKPWVINWQ
jgi:hypothetical protein